MNAFNTMTIKYLYWIICTFFCITMLLKRRHKYMVRSLIIPTSHSFYVNLGRMIEPHTHWHALAYIDALDWASSINTSIDNVRSTRMCCTCICTDTHTQHTHTLICSCMGELKSQPIYSVLPSDSVGKSAWPCLYMDKHNITFGNSDGWIDYIKRSIEYNTMSATTRTTTSDFTIIT